MELVESPHPFDPDAFEVTWDHNGHNHFIVVPREFLTQGKVWIQRHATRVDASCDSMFKAAS